jgi:hypothetical protein
MLGVKDERCLSTSQEEFTKKNYRVDNKNKPKNSMTKGKLQIIW